MNAQLRLVRRIYVVDGTKYIFGFHEGRLRAIYKRVAQDRGPAAGGVFIFDQPFWHAFGRTDGRLSRRAQDLVDRIFGLSIPDDMRFVDRRKKQC